MIGELEAQETRLVLYRAGGPADSLDGVPVSRRQVNHYVRALYRLIHCLGVLEIDGNHRLLETVEARPWKRGGDYLGTGI